MSAPEAIDLAAVLAAHADACDCTLCQAWALGYFEGQAEEQRAAQDHESAVLHMALEKIAALQTAAPQHMGDDYRNGEQWGLWTAAGIAREALGAVP